MKRFVSAKLGPSPRVDKARRSSRAGLFAWVLGLSLGGIACKKNSPSTVTPATSEDEELPAAATASKAQREVEALIAKGELNQALNRADELLGQHPQDAGLHYAKGAALQRLGQDAQGRASMQRAIELDKAFVPAYIALARDHAFGEQDYAKALEYAESAVKIAPKQPQALLVRAMIVHDAGDPAKARDQLEKAVGSGVQDPGLYTELARLQAASGDFDKAQASLRAALKLTPPPERVPAQLLLGRVQLAAKQPERADKTFAAVIQANPDNWDVKLAVIRAYLGAGLPAKAEPIAEQVAKALGDQAPALVALGRVRLAQGRLDGKEGALALMDAALAKDGQSVAAHLGRSFALVGLGRCKDAKQSRASIPAAGQGSPRVAELDKALAACKAK